MIAVAWLAAFTAVGVLLGLDEHAAADVAPVAALIVLVAWAFLLNHHERTHRDRTR